jgi:hypothetical protein
MAEEGNMKRGMLLFCIMTVIGFGVENALAASGKCTVVKVDGERMVIECNKQAKGFSEGNEIKIKTDQKKTNRNK